MCKASETSQDLFGCLAYQSCSMSLKIRSFSVDSMMLLLRIVRDGQFQVEGFELRVYRYVSFQMTLKIVFLDVQ